MLAVSVGGYVNFALEEPCPEKYFGSQKCYIYSYPTYNKNNLYSKKRIYIKKPWASFDETNEEKVSVHQES
tara:strand:- start:294 stop:506 length:213 start_codon:yes stop_codon:yes gene_type:complete